MLVPTKGAGRNVSNRMASASTQSQRCLPCKRGKYGTWGWRIAGRSRITPHNTHPVHSVTPIASTHRHGKRQPAMPSGRNRIQNMPAIQLPRGDEVERGDKETYPTRNQDGVGKQVIQRRHTGNPGREDPVQKRDRSTAGETGPAPEPIRRRPAARAGCPRSWWGPLPGIRQSVLRCPLPSAPGATECASGSGSPPRPFRSSVGAGNT